jgi:hypothetical protein
MWCRHPRRSQKAGLNEAELSAYRREEGLLREQREIKALAMVLRRMKKARAEMATFQVLRQPVDANSCGEGFGYSSGHR